MTETETGLENLEDQEMERANLIHLTEYGSTADPEESNKLWSATELIILYNILI